MAVNSNPPIDLDPSMDEGHKLTFINQNFHSLADSLNPYRLSDGSNDRLLIGKDSTGSYVVKVSKAGFNAFDTADANLVFNSGQNVFKIVSSGTLTIPGFTVTSGGAGVYAQNSSAISTAHGLGIIPMVTAVLNISPNFYPLPYVSATPGGGATALWLQIYCWSDSTTLHFGQSAMSVGLTVAIPAAPIKYYLLQETAN